MLKIRLRRMGKRHSPFYRVVVSDSRRTPTASAVDEVGHYDPQPTPPRLALNLDRLRYWQEQGARLSPTVRRLVQRAESGTLEAPAAEPAKPARADKAKGRSTEQAAREAAPAPAAEVSDDAPQGAEVSEEAPQAATAPAEEAPRAAAEAIAVDAIAADAASEAAAEAEPVAGEPVAEAEPAATDEGDEKPTEA
jgi:small subunit ribosomal protein S16